MAIYVVTVAADGSVAAVTANRSSGSAAIDAAALAAVTAARFTPGTNAAGEPISSDIRLSLRYAAYLPRGSSGGLANYRCRDLTREYDWFQKSGKGLFWPENAYVGRLMLENPGVDRRDARAVARQRAVYTKEWRGVIKACRKAPDALMVTKLDDPDGYRRMFALF